MTKDASTLAPTGEPLAGGKPSNIVWLASYPRSGNTLSRHILKNCLGVSTISEDDFPAGPARDEHKAGQGVREEIPEGMTWPEYVAMAEADDNVHVVKTHGAPQDDRKAVYVIRDGRKAVWSYRCFQRDWFAEKGRNLYEILLGADPNGTWASHVQSWLNRPAGSTFFMRYEELTNISEARLKELAAFLGTRNEIKPWVNNFEEMQAKNPRFYREGKQGWSPPDEWTSGVDEIFRALQGGMMEQLGYWIEGEAGTFLSAEMQSFLQLASGEAILSWQRRVELQRVTEKSKSRISKFKQQRESDQEKIAKLKAKLKELQERTFFQRLFKKG